MYQDTVEEVFVKDHTGLLSQTGVSEAFRRFYDYVPLREDAGQGERYYEVLREFDGGLVFRLTTPNMS